MLIRMVKFCRSTMLVEICTGSGDPATTVRSACVTCGGAYGRKILPSSLRPQMNRLKADGVLVYDSSTDTWNLTPEKRLGYVMFDHPMSRKAMQELQDDQILDNEPRTRLRDMAATPESDKDIQSKFERLSSKPMRSLGDLERINKARATEVVRLCGPQALTVGGAR
jgi:hypothetical protein